MIETNGKAYNGIRFIPEDILDVYFMHFRDSLDDCACPKCGMIGLSSSNLELDNRCDLYDYVSTRAYKNLLSMIIKNNPELIKDSENDPDPICYGGIFIDDDLIEKYDEYINDIFCECEYFSSFTGLLRSRYSKFIYSTLTNATGSKMPLTTKLILRE